MNQEIEKAAPLCESGTERTSEATTQDSCEASTLSDVDTEVQREDHVMHGEECMPLLEEYVQREMHVCCEPADAVAPVGNQKELILARITSRLEDLKSSFGGKDLIPGVSVTRSFLQYSNELMCSFDSKSSKAVRNVIARFGDYVAVGDSNGHVLILQTSSQKGNLLKHGAGATEHVGGVTALKMVSYGKSILLVSGHASGVLRIWELRFNQQWIHCKDISGCHAATISSIGVTHVGMSMWLLSADTHGRLLSHNVQRYLSITAQALAGISRQLTGQSTTPSYLNTIRVGDMNDIGVVLSISGPYLHDGLATSSEMSCPYMILCTEKGTLLVEVAQNGRVEYHSTLAGFDANRQSGIYSAAWRRVDSRDDADTVIAAVSSGDVVNTYRCKIPKKTGKNIKIDHIKCLTHAGMVQGVTYIQDEAVLACVYFDGESGKTRMALVQEQDYCRGKDIVVESYTTIECIDTSDWVISQPIDHLVTVDLVWHGSLVGGPDIMLLTSSGIQCTQLLSWQQKLGMMVASELYEDALLHVSRLYYSLQDVESKSNTRNWPANRVEPHDLPAVKKQFASLLIMYLQQALDNFRSIERSTGIEAVDRNAMCGIVHLAFDACCLLDSLEMFYRDIASVLQEEGNEHSMSWEIYIEVLSCSIRQGVYSSTLPPDLIRMLVENLISRSEIQSIEQLLLSLEISSLDLNQIIPLCIKHELHSVILYVFSQGLKDYKTPAALLFSSAVQEYMSSRGTGLAMKLMVYIYACFNGFLYPRKYKHGVSEQEQAMKLEAMDFILFSTLEQLVEVVHLWDSVANITRDHAWVSFCEKMYPVNPVLDFLCDINVTECLDLLRELFSGWDALVQDIIQHRGDSQTRDSGDTFRTLSQATVDKLVEVLNLEEKPPEEMDAVKMNFILHHVASERASLPPEAAFSVLLYLLHTSKVNPRAFESCQKSFEDIIDHLDDLPDGRLMDMAHQAGFSSAEARIYRKRGQYLKGLLCILEPQSDNKKAFMYYRDIMSDSKISWDEKMDFQRSSVPYFPRMVEIDPDSTAEIAIDYAGEQRQEIISSFDPDSNVLFSLLQSLISKTKERSGEEDQKMVCGMVCCPMLSTLVAFY